MTARPGVESESTTSVSQVMSDLVNPRLKSWVMASMDYDAP